MTQDEIIGNFRAYYQLHQIGISEMVDDCIDGQGRFQTSDDRCGLRLGVIECQYITESAGCDYRQMKELRDRETK